MPSPSTSPLLLPANNKLPTSKNKPQRTFRDRVFRDYVYLPHKLVLSPVAPRISIPRRLHMKGMDILADSTLFSRTVLQQTFILSGLAA